MIGKARSGKSLGRNRSEVIARTSAPGDTREKTAVDALVETPAIQRVATPQRILDLLAAHPDLSLSEVAARIGKSLSAVERAATKLVRSGKLKHIGPTKGGHWEVSK